MNWLREHGNQILVGLIVAAIAGTVGLIVRALLDGDDDETMPTTTPSANTTAPPDDETSTSGPENTTTTIPDEIDTTTTAPTTSTTTTTTTSTTTTTTLPPTFLEQVSGRWELIDWRETPQASGVTLGMGVIEGELFIDTVGNGYWDLDLDDGGPEPQFTPGVVCLGVVEPATETLAGNPGRLVVDGDDMLGTERDWTRNLQSLRGDAGVAFCGWTFEFQLFVYDSTTSDYRLDLSTMADDARTPLLSMENTAGTFRWRRLP